MTQCDARNIRKKYTFRSSRAKQQSEVDANFSVLADGIEQLLNSLEQQPNRKKTNFTRLVSPLITLS